jgi:proteasome lid subunit RPN8/RPN11
MRWTERAPDLPFQAIADLGHRLGRADDWQPEPGGITVLVPHELQAGILAHLSERHVEQGGLLLGEVFTLDGSEDPEKSLAVLLTRAIPAAEFSGSGVSLRMESDLWEQARAGRGPMDLVVGWYHSHPGLGAFFSATDRRTQLAFFGQPYSIGWVIDPFRLEHAVFIGANCNAPARFVELPDVTTPGVLATED